MKKEIDQDAEIVALAQKIFNDDPTITYEELCKAVEKQLAGVSSLKIKEKVMCLIRAKAVRLILNITCENPRISYAQLVSKVKEELPQGMTINTFIREMIETLSDVGCIPEMRLFPGSVYL